MITHGPRSMNPLDSSQHNVVNIPHCNYADIPVNWDSHVAYSSYRSRGCKSRARTVLSRDMAYIPPKYRARGTQHLVFGARTPSKTAHFINQEYVGSMLLSTPHNTAELYGWFARACAPLHVSYIQ